MTTLSKRDAQIWESVKEYQQHNHCRCELRPGMSHDELMYGVVAHSPSGELIPEGRGCKSTPEFGWICESLDYYRRMVSRPYRKPEVEEEA